MSHYIKTKEIIKKCPIVIKTLRYVDSYQQLGDTVTIKVANPRSYIRQEVEFLLKSFYDCTFAFVPLDIVNSLLKPFDTIESPEDNPNLVEKTVQLGAITIVAGASIVKVTIDEVTRLTEMILAIN